jgi:hypothetical protein
VVDAFAAHGVADRVFHKEMFFTDEALAGQLETLMVDCSDRDCCLLQLRHCAILRCSSSCAPEALVLV